jgi:hypothetical protein
MNINYVHTEIPELSAAFLDEGIVRIGSDPKARELRGMIEVALGTMDLAIRLGIRPPLIFGIGIEGSASLSNG